MALRTEIPKRLPHRCRTETADELLPPPPPAPPAITPFNSLSPAAQIPHTPFLKFTAASQCRPRGLGCERRLAPAAVCVTMLRYGTTSLSHSEALEDYDNTDPVWMHNFQADTRALEASMSRAVGDISAPEPGSPRKSAAENGTYLDGKVGDLTAYEKLAKRFSSLVHNALFDVLIIVVRSALGGDGSGSGRGRGVADCRRTPPACLSLPQPS